MGIQIRAPNPFDFGGYKVLCRRPVLKNLYYVYILASKRNGTLYVGMTRDVLRRVIEHKQGLVKGFTKRYGIRTLVYYEQTSDVNAAIQRERRIKKWNRSWKLELIEKYNPDGMDLFRDGAILPLPCE